jgi:hypothetical protein
VTKKNKSRRSHSKKNRSRRSNATKKQSASSRKIILAAADVSRAASEIARHADKIALHVAGITGAAQEDPLGSCIYMDKQGQVQCEGPVTESYCNGIQGGHFRAGGRCS